jgi:hypothetical protein
MAFVQTIGAFGQEKVLFNIEQSVGANGVNAPDDVRLVQYLLRAHYGVCAAGLAMDGWGGPETNGWIKAFQEDMRAAGNNVLVDGRLDRAFGETSSVSHTVYGMVLLNLSVARNNPAAFGALPHVVELNPNPRANPYDAPLPRIMRAELRGSLCEFAFEDGSYGQYVVPKNHSLYIDNVEIRRGYTYERMPDGSLREISNANPWGL